LRIDDFCTKFELGYFEKVWVKSFDDATLEISWQVVTRAFKSAEVAELVQITTRNGSSVTCTPDHEIFTKNRSWVKACELVPEDRLLGDIGSCLGVLELNSLHKPSPVPVFDLTVEDTHTFFANGIGISNCTEISIPSKPLNSIDDGLADGAEIALCTLAAINWGKINKPSDFEQPCRMAVRLADADYQDYPVRAAREATLARRPLGVGIIGLAHFLAKRGLPYGRMSLAVIDEFAEAWSYYLIKASVELAKEKGPCPLWKETKYADGWFPHETRPAALDKLLPHKTRMPWEELRADMLKYGIRNSTLMACMPSETSSQLSNETNGVEPAMGPVIIKSSKDAAPPIAVPEVDELMHAYDWLWDQKSPRGYLEVTAMIQKHTDQAMSINTSYNPKHFKNEKLDTGTLAQDIMYAYSLGHKNLYYQNTRKPGESDILGFTEDNSESGCEGGACSI
jgi:ribonucleoside-diphosphate reductase alpha chain